MRFLLIMATVVATTSLAAPASAEDHRRPIYAIAHHANTIASIDDTVAAGANAIEIDFCAGSTGWKADHDCLGLGLFADARALLRTVADQVRAGHEVAFVWIDIKNPDAYSTGPGSVVALRTIVREELESVGIEALFGFYGYEGGVGWSSIKNDLNAFESIVASGTADHVQSSFGPSGIPTGKRAMDQGLAVIGWGFGDCTEPSGKTCADLRNGAALRDQGQLSKVFGWTTDWSSDWYVDKMLGTAGVDGIIFGYAASTFSDSYFTRDARADITDWVAAHGTTHRLATMADSLTN